MWCDSIGSLDWSFSTLMLITPSKLVQTLLLFIFIQRTKELFSIIAKLICYHCSFISVIINISFSTFFLLRQGNPMQHRLVSNLKSFCLSLPKCWDCWPMHYIQYHCFFYSIILITCAYNKYKLTKY